MDELSKKMTNSQQMLAARSIDRSNRIARRYAKLFPEFAEECEEAAVAGTIRAATTFDPDRESAVWGRWLKLCVDGSIKNHLRFHFRRKDIRRKDGSQLPEQAQEDASLSGMEIREEVTQLLGYLSPSQRSVCTLFYRNGHSPSEAARELGITEVRGCILHQEAINRLRRRFSS